jgi:acetyl-CoA carboxylase/biotin carboxylase 1
MELYLRKTYQRNHSLFSVQSGSSLNPDETNIGGGGRTGWISFEFLTHFLSYNDYIPPTSTGLKEKVLSFSDLSALTKGSASSGEGGGGEGNSREVRSGVVAAIESLSDLPRYFPLILEKISSDHKSQPLNVIHVIILSGPSSDRSDDDTSTVLSNFLHSQVKHLSAKFVRRVTFFVGKSDVHHHHISGSTSSNSNNNLSLFQGKSSSHHASLPSIFTFRQRIGFHEDKIFRNVEAAIAFHLDLNRFTNFNINLAENVETTSGNTLLYKAIPKTGKGTSRRYFARIVCFTADTSNSDLETLFVEALDQLSLALGHEEAQKGKNAAAGGKGAEKGPAPATSSTANHFFINVVSLDSVLSPDFIENTLKKLSTKYWYKMVRLAVTTVELKLTTRLSSQDSNPISLRFVASNPTGYVLKIDKYVEVNVDGRSVFKSVISKSSSSSSSSVSIVGPWDNLDILTPYEITQKFENQRAEAMTSSDTLYVYDWPMLYESATEKLWSDYPSEKMPHEFFSCKELVLFHPENDFPYSGKEWTVQDAQDAVLKAVDREPGLNEFGMVGWHMKISTPEYPSGREFVVICNDITFQAGSFGTKEDFFFFKVTFISSFLFSYLFLFFLYLGI